MKTALILSTACITALGDSEKARSRVEQYKKGFLQVKDLVTKMPDFDVFFVDSTLSETDAAKLDENLMSTLKSIPNLRKVHFFENNFYGKRNKGAGLIVQWQAIMPFIEKENDGAGYKFIVHFEPRQELENYSFFERFMANPATYIKTEQVTGKKFRFLTKTWTQMLTGLFSWTSAGLKSYITCTHPMYLTFFRKSIEEHLMKFIQRRKFPFTHVDELGMIWYEVTEEGYKPHRF